MDSVDIKNMIIKNVSKLKSLDVSLGRIGLSHDLSPEQRKKLRSKIEEARALEASDKGGAVGRNIGGIKNDRTNNNFCVVKIKLGLLNIRSIGLKYNIIYDLISDGSDIFVVTESWHGSSENPSIALSTPPGYRFVNCVRDHDPLHGSQLIVRSLFCSLFTRDAPKFGPGQNPAFFSNPAKSGPWWPDLGPDLSVYQHLKIL
ncbi:hypothetical protein HELRODRAFT_191357 [Helobdella robusta]|uniref:Uncharacterized protein n=1 Tax=Helobdella robusta TaxID=6412 RepID=T1FSX1_HELRO|nr:hypothetical protein HELRODRAFT_191357 [Helobdella robusta]ESO05694.1 hypothetical protein HELRODRAFT_191357 [Helobdella robusta]